MSARPIRVLHLRDSPWVDGPGRTILDTATHLDAQRVEYHVGAFVPQGSTGDHPLVRSLRAAGASVRELTDRGGLDRELVAAIVRLVDELKIDVLHSSEFRSNVMALLVRRQRKVMLVATVHGWIVNNLRGRIYRFVDKVLLRWFEGLIFVSAATRRLIPSWWLPQRRTCVLHNGLVLEKYGKAIVAAPRKPVDVNKVTVLNVGRLSPEKGQDLLLRAIAQLVGRFPGLRLEFAGTGPQESSLRALAQALGVSDRAHFLGYIGDMPAVYAKADLLVQSSLTEGLPNVILEAANLRLPMVATTVGGTAEIVEHRKSGWLIAPGDVDEIKSGIEAFLTRPEEFVAMSAVAQQGIRERFSFDVRTQRLMDFYERLCAGVAR